LRYLSCLAHVDAVVGNSSSGLLEAPSFNIGTIDIGERQKGRLKADSVIECEPSASSIRSAFEELYSESFQASLPNASNPYGSGQAVDAIIKVLLDYPLEHILQKTFFDLPLVTEIKGDSFQ
jgi:GDP/UDP-N,N'-diacetylbacillosamine 2-epimerase (hydrolysing)